jgi:hypothetical protein
MDSGKFQVCVGLKLVISPSLFAQFFETPIAKEISPSTSFSSPQCLYALVSFGLHNVFATQKFPFSKSRRGISRDFSDAEYLAI